MFTQTITLTLGDVAENHVGMQKIGTKAANGFQLEDMQHLRTQFESLGHTCEWLNLGDMLLPEERKASAETAVVLVIRQGVNALMANQVADGTTSATNDSDKLYADRMYTEQCTLEPDRHMWSRRHGRVLNKRARWNLCFAENGQDADLEHGRGTIVPFHQVPLLKNLCVRIGACMDSARGLHVEGNYYVPEKTGCYIGFHGDTERRKVMGVRLGSTMPLYYQWFHQGVAVGQMLTVNLAHGDMYVMSEKASGYDWMRRNKLTLRHAAGTQALTLWQRQTFQKQQQQQKRKHETI